MKVRGAVQFGFDELETMPFHCGMKSVPPAPRGGTDFMSLQGRFWPVLDIVIRQTASAGIGMSGHSLPEAILLRISFN
jgi:hypothetical protein